MIRSPNVNKMGRAQHENGWFTNHIFSTPRPHSCLVLVTKRSHLALTKLAWMTRGTPSLLLSAYLTQHFPHRLRIKPSHARTKITHTMVSRSFTLFTITTLLLIIGSASAYKYHDPEYDPDEPPRRPREREREYDPERPRERERKYDPEVRPRRQSDSPFLLQESKQVVQTDAGQMRVVRGFGVGLGGIERPLHIGFITMEPKSLFVPQYMDSSLIIFIRRGNTPELNSWKWKWKWKCI